MADRMLDGLVRVVTKDGGVVWTRPQHADAVAASLLDLRLSDRLALARRDAS